MLVFPEALKPLHGSSNTCEQFNQAAAAFTFAMQLFQLACTCSGGKTKDVACREETPATLDFKVMEGSMYNTPPCWAIYMCGLVFNHMLRNGGIEAMQKTNKAKAKVLYDAIDGSDGFYVNPIAKADRSNMNVPFTIPSSQELEAVFVKEAAAAGMVSIHAFISHRSAGCT